ncbi:hypothetical protein CRG98_001872 [Punica granatum]|uniref:Uncharacterized protein n=1 Tax=Punica granatum TaxID=22663 RepID=A0A2I0LAP0_PUNGR|nr:hypothetical protein CRG98_001872 [Punica granatum]
MQGMQKQRLVLGNGTGRQRWVLGIGSGLCWDGAAIGVIGCMLDDLCRVLGGDGLITVFTGDTVACECCHSEAVLRIGLTLGTKTHLVSAGVAAGTKLLRWYLAPRVAVCLIYRRSGWLCFVEGLLCRRDGCALLEACFAPGAVVCLIYRKPASPLGRLLVALPDADSVAGAIVVCWGCSGLAMKDSNS